MKRLPGPPSFTLLPGTPSLTIEEIEEVAASFKEDLTGECERRVRRNDGAGALAAIQGKEHIDKFVYALKLRAGSQLDTLRRPPRARAIHIRGDLTKRKDRQT